MLVFEVAAGEAFHVDLGAEGDVDGGALGGAGFAELDLDGFGGREQSVGFEGEGVEVGGMACSLGHEVEHF